MSILMKRSQSELEDQPFFNLVEVVQPKEEQIKKDTPQTFHLEKDKEKMKDEDEPALPLKTESSKSRVVSDENLTKIDS